MPQRTATIGSSVGLHARPATLFVQAATKSGLAVTIAKEGGDPVDARSLLAVMALGAGHGDKVVLSADGEGADEGLAELGTLLETDLDA
ncbi:phosphocarrier protein HPr [Murinocardiopsis flavida]|uniref:Phosphocarrier protein HPr n=1 Tax=Murinocardiopsis flavida TaxID=645275 RepID=A0A2P8DEQ9_9ACTN|nr:HPr family phosphocarrier protein [Murinocardiopsis flavida]PSK95678.1 phosphocarrier protein HPr [Murinocardiopsis flavida]